MKKLFVFLLFFCSITILFAHRDRIERPQRINIEYDTGEIIKVEFYEQEIVSISIVFKDKVVIVPDRIIEEISNIHFNTLNLLWDGTYESAAESTYFYIRFEYGAELFYGVYPEMSIHFRDYQFEDAEIIRNINESTRKIYILQ